jgi:hypothetical protein
MGWGTKTTDTKKLKRFLMRKGKEFCKEFERVYKEVDQALLAAGCDLYGGDSVGDCRHHIIGLGKAEYDKVMADQTVGDKRYADGDYTESFSYCTPYKSDWEDVEDGERLIKWAKENMTGYRHDKKRLAKFIMVPQVKAILDEIDKALELHRPMMQEPPDLKAFAESGPSLKAASEKAKELFDKLIAGLTGNTGNYNDDTRSTIDNKWSVWNLVSDVEKVQAFLAGE